MLVKVSCWLVRQIMSSSSLSGEEEAMKVTTRALVDTCCWVTLVFEDQNPPRRRERKTIMKVKENSHSFMILIVLLHAYLYYSSLTEFLSFCA